MKKLITLLLALLFILTACAPAVVEQTPAPVETPEPTVEATPEPTVEPTPIPTEEPKKIKQGAKNTVILVGGGYVDNEKVMQNFISWMEPHCTQAGYEFYYIDAHHVDVQEAAEARLRELLTEKKDENVICVFTRPNLTKIAAELGASVVLYGGDIDFLSYDSEYTYEEYAEEIGVDHSVLIDSFSNIYSIADKLAKVCDGKDSILYTTNSGASGVTSPYDLAFKEVWFDEGNGYDLSNTEIVNVPKYADEYSIYEYIVSDKVDCEQVCLYSFWLDYEFYLEKLYEKGLTDDEIFHVEELVLNETSVKNVINGKVDILYGYTQDAMSQLLLDSIDRIFAGEEVEERICVETVILSSKEQAQAYYNDNFA